ncbi:MAG: chorismate mutase, partial [Planctomycetaceae bacterium]|nr:chorismate mutase [Planctomycetaceae bacterium]
NGLTDFSEIVSAIFTTTPDLTACFPAEAAREQGMSQVPLLCASEIAVPTGMPRTIRILLHVNTDRSQAEMVHVYLRDARKLRPDVTSAQ